MKKENSKYVEPNNYFTDSALKVFGLDKKSQEEAKRKAEEEKKRENEELKKIFKGKK